MILKPNRSWFDLELREFIHYRDLIILLVHRDFVARFKQTILGPAWLILQPLLGSIVFTLIFGVVAGMPTDGLPTFLFYLCGQLGWNYFAHTYGSSSGTLQQNSSLYGKVYFPRLIPPVAVCISNLITFAIQALVFASFWVYFQTTKEYVFNLTAWTLLLPTLLLQKALLAMGLGFLMSSLTVRYRDFAQLSGFIMQFMMYCTPIIFPLSLLINKLPTHYAWVIHLNPLAYIIEMYRLMFLGTATIPPYLPLTSWMLTLFLFISGLMVFNKVQRTYIDYL